MPHSFGTRARTRKMFSKGFRKHGNVLPSKSLEIFKVGDIVDVKADGSVQKGMPSKVYHGKTGKVWNVTKRGVGVELTKTVRHRVMRKRISVRTEHVSMSKCRDDYHARVAQNDAVKAAAKAEGKPRPCVKRTPILPKEGAIVKCNPADVITFTPIKYVFTV